MIIDKVYIDALDIFCNLEIRKESSKCKPIYHLVHPEGKLNIEMSLDPRENGNGIFLVIDENDILIKVSHLYDIKKLWYYWDLLNPNNKVPRQIIYPVE